MNKMRSKNKIFIQEDVLFFIEKESRCSIYTETGGIIGGFGSFEDNNIIITKASDCGPNSKKKYNFFSRDTKYCQQIVDQWASKSSGEIDYLGEWHKHLESNPKPSSLDISTLTRIALSKNYHVLNPILVIIGNSNSRESLKTFVFNSHGSYINVEWNIY